MRSAKLLLTSTVGLYVLIQAFVWFQYAGPAPKPLSAPDDEFSAERAQQILKRLLDDQAPHPAGSSENILVRDRLIAELKSLDMEVEVESSVPDGNNPALHNVFARDFYGRTTGRPLMLVTHYDSCRRGPGAGDSGAAVAALIECARALKHGPRPERPIYFLFTDGEEGGLLGAKFFVSDHVAALSQPFVLNFDARGSSGPSLLYETHFGNREIIRSVGPKLPRPALTGSAFVTVYRQLPNDTDFSVFRKAKWQGLNFAFIGGAHRYHMPDDRIENLDLRSIQHHGENALAIARFMSTETRNDYTANVDAVFFDILGQWVLWFPMDWMFPVSLIVLGTLSVSHVHHWRKTNFLGENIQTAAWLLIGVLVTTLVGYLVNLLLETSGALPTKYVSYGNAINFGYFIVSLLMACEVAKRLSFAHFQSTESTVWFLWAIAGALLSYKFPGIGYIVVLPAMLACASQTVSAPPCVSAAIGAACSAILTVPILNLLSDALGPHLGVVLCPLFFAALTPLIPLFAFYRKSCRVHTKTHCRFPGRSLQSS